MSARVLLPVQREEVFQFPAVPRGVSASLRTTSLSVAVPRPAASCWCLQLLLIARSEYCIAILYHHHAPTWYNRSMYGHRYTVPHNHVNLSYVELRWEWVCVGSFNGTSAHKRTFSAIQRLKTKLGMSDTYRQIKRCGRTKAI